MSSTSTAPAVALEASRLGKRYGRRAAALDDCSFRLPAGRISALVGPNGAGKSTLLALAAGLLRPTSGTLTVLGGAPGAFRERVCYLAQNKPLYPRLTVAETLRMGAELNPARWDAAYAHRIVEEGSLDHGARIRALSGGQRTRVALALALGKRPDLMLLDEPMADLDPLARHELMGTLMADAAEPYFLVYAFRGNHWTFQGRYQQPELRSHSWAVTSSGARIDDPDCCTDQACLARHDIVGFGRAYLPSPDHWPRRLLETGVLLALTALTVAAAFAVLRRRADV